MLNPLYLLSTLRAQELCSTRALEHLYNDFMKVHGRAVTITQSPFLHNLTALLQSKSVIYRCNCL